MQEPPRVLGIVLFEGVEELDAVGPWEVLAHWTTTYPDDGYAVTTLAPEASPVHCAKGLVIEPR
jgi:putative intracellular protease/amidase